MLLNRHHIARSEVIQPPPPLAQTLADSRDFSIPAANFTLPPQARHFTHPPQACHDRLFFPCDAPLPDFTFLPRTRQDILTLSHLRNRLLQAHLVRPV